MGEGRVACKLLLAICQAKVVFTLGGGGRKTLLGL